MVEVEAVEVVVAAMEVGWRRQWRWQWLRTVSTI
jgi:hypothetical protein